MKIFTSKATPLLAVLLVVLLPTQPLSQQALLGNAASLTEMARSSSVPFAQAIKFVLKDGDRVVFYGDSITEQRLYTTYVEHYVLTHYPDRHVTFINTGWGGDKVTGNDCQPCAGVGGLARLKRDVIDHRPSVVTLLFGMNDGKYEDFNPATLKVYEDGLTAIVRELKTQTRARIYVMTPTVYDGTRHTAWSHTDHYNEVLDHYSEAAKQLAAREGLPVIDLHSVTTTALRKAKAIDPNYTFLPDGVHPEADGQLVMAAEILRSWGTNPRGFEIVKQVKPDANGNARVNVQAPLPWPDPAPSETLRRVGPEIAELGNVKLKVTGLPTGTFTVTLNGASAGEFTAERLNDGISLGGLFAQAAASSQALAALIRQRADLFFMRWRQIEVPFSKYQKTSNAVSALDTLIDEMAKRARVLGQPHQYQLGITRKT
jgi:lysophospholipase L1-like esterase